MFLAGIFVNPRYKILLNENQKLLVKEELQDTFFQHNTISGKYTTQNEIESSPVMDGLDDEEEDESKKYLSNLSASLAKSEQSDHKRPIEEMIEVINQGSRVKSKFVFHTMDNADYYPESLIMFAKVFLQCLYHRSL